MSVESISDATFVSQPNTQIIDGDFHWEQRKDPKLKQLIDYLEMEKLPNDDHDARKVTSFILMDRILYLLDGRTRNRRRAVVPCHLQRQIHVHVLHNYHSGPMAGHFSGNILYNALCYNNGVYTDTMRYCEHCAEYIIAMGVGRRKKPLLHLIPVNRPFQILGVDVIRQ